MSPGVFSQATMPVKFGALPSWGSEDFLTSAGLLARCAGVVVLDVLDALAKPV